MKGFQKMEEDFGFKIGQEIDCYSFKSAIRDTERAINLAFREWIFNQFHLSQEEINKSDLLIR